LLTGAYHLIRRKTLTLLSELFGIAVSLGAISAMEQRASVALASAHDEALREVQYAGVKHSDATTWTRAGKLMSLWTMASVAATVYRIFADGCRETILPMFGPRLGFLVSDRATVFGFWAMALRQVCHAHLLRKYVAFSERDGPAGCIGLELLELTSLVFEYWHGFKEGHLTRQELQVWMRPVQRDIERALERGAAAGAARAASSQARAPAPPSFRRAVRVPLRTAARRARTALQLRDGDRSCASVGTPCSLVEPRTPPQTPASQPRLPRAESPRCARAPTARFVRLEFRSDESCRRPLIGRSIDQHRR
jgi:hypothetical protein